MVCFLSLLLCGSQPGHNSWHHLQYSSQLLTTGHPASPLARAALLQAELTSTSPAPLSSPLTHRSSHRGVSAAGRALIAITVLCSRASAITSLEPAALQPPSLSLCLRGCVIKTTSSRLHSSLVTESEK